MAQFEPHKEEFEKAGLGIAYIAGQSRKGLLGAGGYLRSHPVSFPYLCDESRDVVKSYGIYRAIALNGVRVAQVSVFLVNPERRIVYRYVGKNQYDRVSPEQLLQVASERLA